MNIVVILLYIILTPIILKSVVKRRFKNASIEFETIDINIFSYINVSGLSYNSKNYSFSADYVNIGVSAFNLLFKQYKINYLKIINAKLSIKKMGKNGKLIIPPFILNGLSIRNMNVFFPNGYIKDVFLLGNIDARKKIFNFSQISNLINIEKTVNDMPIIACRFKGDWKDGIHISEGKLYTEHSKIFFNGNIKNNGILKFSTNHLDLRELNKYILFGKGNGMIGIGKGYMKLHFSKNKNLMYGNFTSPQVNLADLLFKKVIFGIKVIFKEQKVHLYFKSGTLFDSPLNGQGVFAHGKLNIQGEFSNLNIGNIFVKAQTGAKKISSLNGQGNIYIDYIKKLVSIDFFNIKGSLLDEKISPKSSLTLNYDMDKNLITIPNGCAYAKNGDFGSFSITGDPVQEKYILNIGKIVRTGPFGSRLYAKLFAKIDGKKYSGILSPEKIAFKNNVLKNIDITGKVKFNNYDKTYIRLILKPGKINLFKNIYTLSGNGIIIKGIYRNALKVNIRPVKATKQSDYSIELHYDKRGTVKGNGRLMLKELKGNNNIDNIMLSFDAFTKGYTHYANVNINDIFIKGQKLLSQEKITLSYDRGKINGTVKGDNLNAFINYYQRKFKSELKINNLDLNKILYYINGEKSEFSGLINTKLTIDNTLSNPRGKLEFKIDNLARLDKYIGLLQGKISYANHKLYITKINAYHKLYYINVKGYVPIKLAIYPFKAQIADAPFEIKTELSDAESDFLQYLFVDIPFFIYKKKIFNFPFKGDNGTFDGKIRLYGTFESPEVESKIKMNNIGGKVIINKAIQYNISHSNGSIILNYDRQIFNLTLQDISLDIGQNKQIGTLGIHGLVSYDNDEGSGRIFLKLIKGSFPINLDDYKGVINELSLKLALLKIPVLSGNIVISDGKIKKKVFNVIDYVINTLQKKKVKANKVKGLSIASDYDFELNLNVSTLNPISFIGTDQNFTISFKNFNISGNNKNLKFGGNINILGGEVYKFGSTFTFQPSFINFVNSQFIDPNLDIAMQSLITGIRVNIDISGKYSQPIIKLSSIPHFSSLQILSLILFKNVNLHSLNNFSISSLGINFLLSELTGELFKLSGKTSFGYALSNIVDNIKIERISFNSNGDLINRWRFSLGKYIFPELYIGYSRYSNIKYDQLLEFKIFINPQLVLSLDLNISPYESRSFGDSIYIMMIREFDLSKLFKIRK